MRLPAPSARWRPVLTDGALAAFLFLWSLPRSHRPLTEVGLTLLLTAPVAVRRRYPATAFALVSLTAFVQWLARLNVGVPDFAILICLYSVAAYTDRRRSVPALGIGLLGAVLAWEQAWSARGVSPLAVVPPLAVVVAVWLVARTMRTRRRYLAELEQKAVRLERERDALARAAVAEERGRIAREMHDVVAHTVAVMVAQAEGAGVAVRSCPADAERALEVISDAGRTALQELRRMLGVLREQDAPTGTAPLPGLRDLDELVASMRASGLPVSYLHEGVERELEPTMGLAVYRIAQESLTNALKHAGPGTATRLRYRSDADAVEVEVLDEGTGRPARPGAARPGAARSGAAGHGPAGHGLTGIHERAALFGGRVTAGPTPTGGWRVRAVLPMPGPVR